MAAPKPLLLIGAGGHARACIDVVESSDTFQVAGMIGTPEERGKQVLGYDVIGTDAELGALRNVSELFLIAVGQIPDPSLRIGLFERAIAAGLAPATVIARSAVASPHAEIGAGTILMQGAIVNAGARIGRNCIVNSRALIEHDADIGDHCHISTGAIVNGGVKIAPESFVGSGAVIREGLRLGRRTVISMGTVLRRSPVADAPAGDRSMA